MGGSARPRRLRSLDGRVLRAEEVGGAPVLVRVASRRTVGDGPWWEVVVLLLACLDVVEARNGCPIEGWWGIWVVVVVIPVDWGLPATRSG